jgi:hypothetical protein
MECFSCLYLEAIQLKFASEGRLYCLFGVTLLSKSNTTPRIRQQPHQKPELIIMKNALFWVFSYTKQDFGLLKKYQKPSSNGLDLTELRAWRSMLKTRCSQREEPWR